MCVCIEQTPLERVAFNLLRVSALLFLLLLQNVKITEFNMYGGLPHLFLYVDALDTSYEFELVHSRTLFCRTKVFSCICITSSCRH